MLETREEYQVDRVPMQHELKCHPEYFREVIFRRKNFEVRKNDRDFRLGDELLLQEYHPEHGYSNRWCVRTIIYILDDPQYCKDGYVILGIE